MSGETVVVVKKQELPLTFGKRGAEAARSSLAELNQSQLVPNCKKQSIGGLSAPP
jgi:hypothetical protein